MKIQLALLIIGALAIGVGCSSGVSTKAPPITAKVKEWKEMTKQEKIELIKKQPMPEPARVNMLQRIEQGLE